MNCKICLLYITGLYLGSTYDDISYKSDVATQSHTFEASPYETYVARNAIDRNPATCMRSLAIGLTTEIQTVWWKLDLGDVFNIYSVSIWFKNDAIYETRQRGRFAGFSLYVSDTDVSRIGDIKSSTLCYKDGPNLPPLNITITCIEHGRYVIFYNERLKGVTYPKNYELFNLYTELCEVIIKGCYNASFYGSNCDIPCPNNCKDGTCHIQNGTCFTCTPGWTGIYCDKKCVEGRYGINCSLQCSGHCRKNATCNLLNGQCDRGCDAGWTGYQCNKGSTCDFT